MSNDRPSDEIQYIIIGDTMVNLSQITHIRPGNPDVADEGDYVVNMAGTRRIMLNQKDGKKLWDLLSTRALSVAELTVI